MNPQRARELLAAERARLTVLRQAIGQRDGEEPESDAAALGSDLWDAEFDQLRSDDLRRQWDALERAEARLAAGTYGLSVDSGVPIPDERLEIMPTAERTAEEQSRLEGRITEGNRVDQQPE